MADLSKIKLPNNATYDIKDAKKSGVYNVIGTQTSSTENWTGNINIPALYDGLTIDYFLPYDSVASTSVTLNLTLSDGTTTGAKNVYYSGSTRLTTHYSVGMSIKMTYYSAGSISISGTATTEDRWIADANYNADTKVRQTLIATNYNRPLLMSAVQTSSTTTNTDNVVYRNNSIYANPSTGTITATKFVGALDGNATSATNATTVNSHTVNSDVPANAVFTDTTYTGTSPISVNSSTHDISLSTVPIAKGGTNAITVVGATDNLGLLNGVLQGTKLTNENIDTDLENGHTYYSADWSNTANLSGTFPLGVKRAEGATSGGSGFKIFQYKNYYSNSTYNIQFLTTSSNIAFRIKSSTTAWGAWKKISHSTSIFYGTCTDSSSTVAKKVTLSGNQEFELTTGVTINVKFSNYNSATSPTLSVNDTTAKPIVKFGTTAVGKDTSTSWRSGATCTLTYDGTSWILHEYEPYCVGQANVTGNYNYQLLMAGTSGTSTTAWYTATSKSADLLFNPSTGMLSAPKITTTGNISVAPPEDNEHFPAGGFVAQDVRNATDFFTTTAINFIMGGWITDHGWSSGIHFKPSGGEYSAWEIMGYANKSDGRTKPLYVRGSNKNVEWGSWRKIYDSSNPPTYTEIGTVPIANGGTGGTTKLEATDNIGAINWYEAGTLLTSGTDCDTLTDGKTYYSNQSSLSTTLVNPPVTDSGFKIVTLRSYNSNYPVQIALTAYGTIRVRGKYKSGNNYLWTTWKVISTSIKVNGTTYNANNEGLVTLPNYPSTASDVGALSSATVTNGVLTIS